jgi:hypothetical protein
MLSQANSAFLRPAAPGPMSAVEIDREARAIWENIAGETGSRRGLPGAIARTYLLARDIQRAIENGGMARTMWSLVRFFETVIARSFGMREPRGA